MADYYFDKRKWKRIFAKYGIIFLISFVPIVLFNMYVGNILGKEWLVILIDTVLLLVCVVIGNYIANKIFARADEKIAKRRMEREYVNARSRAILEESYKKKRQEKLEKKKSREDTPADVIEVEETDTTIAKEDTANHDNKTNNVPKTTKSSNKSKTSKRRK